MKGYYREEVGKIVGRIALTLIASALAFCLGAVAGGAICEQWIVPGWLKQYAEGGQIAQGVIAYIIGGAFICAFVVFLLGFLWTVRAGRRPSGSGYVS